MTIADAVVRAMRHNLQPVLSGGWCMLFDKQRGGMVGRGGTWEEAFEHALRKPEAPRPAPPPPGGPTMFDVIDDTCPRCGGSGGGDEPHLVCRECHGRGRV